MFSVPQNLQANKLFHVPPAKTSNSLRVVEKTESHSARHTLTDGVHSPPLTSPRFCIHMCDYNGREHTLGRARERVEKLCSKYNEIIAKWEEDSERASRSKKRLKV